MYGREREEDYFNARIMTEAAHWLEQNRDAKRFFLMVESFDPHEPWFVPEYYRRMYDDSEGREQIPLFVRHPQGTGAGMRSDFLLQHIDISAQVLEFAGVEPPQPLDGQPFWQRAVSSGQPVRDHVIIGWGMAMTVVNDRWWLNWRAVS